MCSCGMTLGVSAIAAMTSSVNSAGCGEVNRTRSSPSISPARAQQLAEGLPVAELDAVGVDVLPEQRHLADALVDQRRGSRRGRRRGGGPSPCRAAPGRCRTCRCCCSRRRPRPRRRTPTRAWSAASTGKTSSDSRISTCASSCDPGALEQHRQRADVVGAEDDVDPGRPRGDLAAVLLRQAAADRDLHARAAWP